MKCVIMKILVKYLCMLFVLPVVAVLASCSDSPSEKLAAATGLSASRPDSAYVLLRQIDLNDFDADSLKAKYILTKAMTNLRVGRSLITDTLLNDAATYYYSAGDTTNWAIASQLLSGYDFIRGDADAAIERLEAMIPRIRNRELLWDTHIHLLELAMNSQRYGDAYGYADWLLNHTDVPEHRLKYASVKGAARYMQGEYRNALEIFDSIRGESLDKLAGHENTSDFYLEYAEILDGAGRSADAVSVIDSLYARKGELSDVEKVCYKVDKAQYLANSGRAEEALRLLESINHENTQSVSEVYSYIGMLKAALQFRQTGRFPGDMAHRTTKTLHRNFQLSQYDRQTALDSVIELNEDKTSLQLQKQRLWLLVCGILLLLLSGGVAVYVILSKRKQRLIEADERIETLSRMVREADDPDRTDRETLLKRMVLKQLGILKTFASVPTPQSEEALRKISNVGFTSESPNPQLVDWDSLFTMVDELYDGFHSKLLVSFPEIFTDKEIQLICLLKADFSTKEISFLTGQSSASVYVRKSAIRKKLGTPGNGDFMAQIEVAL